MSEALRLADILEKMPLGECDEQAAAELRRLHDLVTEDSILQRRQRDEIAQLGQALARAIERNNELEAELAEQARLNGMGSEREARLMAVNAELVEALRCADAMLSGANMDAKAVERKVSAALAKVEVSK